MAGEERVKARGPRSCGLARRFEPDRVALEAIRQGYEVVVPVKRTAAATPPPPVVAVASRVRCVGEGA